MHPGKGRKGINNEYKDIALEYSRLLGGFLFFLRGGIKPSALSDAEFCSFRPVIEKLVGKNQLQMSVLDLFKC
jgi:hypothetical protein